MKLELIPQNSQEEKRAWSMLSNSSVQVTLHNEIVRKVLALRDELETAGASRVAEVQQSIKAHRFLLGLIHRNDTLPTK